jgi:hypothetical protein
MYKYTHVNTQAVEIAMLRLRVGQPLPVVRSKEERLLPPRGQSDQLFQSDQVFVDLNISLT